MPESLTSADQLDAFNRMVPLGRMASPEEIAGAVAYFERTPVSELMGLLARRADRSDLTGVRL